MLQFPAIPSWDALHPLIIHFPIALLLIAPIFIVVGAVLTPAKGRSYLIAAMVLLLVGTASIFVAVESGEAAGKLAERTPGMATSPRNPRISCRANASRFQCAVSDFPRAAGGAMVAEASRHSSDDDHSAVGFPGSVQRGRLAAGQYRPQRRQARARIRRTGDGNFDSRRRQRCASDGDTG